MTRVVFIDDHTTFRQALALLVDHQLELTVVGQAGTVAEGQRMLPEGDLAVIDLALPDGSGVELVRHLQRVQPASRILALAPPSDAEATAAARMAGADQVLSKAVGLGEIMQTVAQLANAGCST